MVSIGVLALVIGLVLLVLEIGLYWSAAAIGDAPPQPPLKLLGGALLVGLTCAGVIFLAPVALGLTPVGVYEWWFLNANSPEETEALSSRVYLATALALLGCWLLPALLFMPLLPVPGKKAFAVSVVLLLLRGLVYALLVGLILVFLAVAQIRRWTEGSPAVSAAVRLLPGPSADPWALKQDAVP